MRMVYSLYAKIFSKKIFYRINRAFFFLGLRGMGILNAESSSISGELYVIKKYLVTGKKIVFDIGANVGDFTQEILIANPEAIIHCFEPSIKTFEKLKERFGNNERVILNNVAVGDFLGEMPLFDSGSGTEHASLIDGLMEGAYKKESNCHVVKVVTLDDYIARHGMAYIDFLKIDVEGFEYQVIKGAQFALNKKMIRKILFEFNFMNTYSKVSMRDFEICLSDFDMFRLLPNELLDLNKLTIAEKEIYLFQNIFAVLKR